MVKAKKKSKKKSGKKSKEKKEKVDPILAEIKSKMKGFAVQILNKIVECTISYILKFRHIGLQKITGGALGGFFGEISGPSGCGKSYLLYELIADCLKVGGYAWLSDPEKAYQPAYGRKAGIGSNDKFFYTKESSIEANFKVWRRFVNGIRKVDKKCPIIIGCDSFSGLQTQVDLTNADALKDPKGYESMQKNAKFNGLLTKFCGFIEKNNVTFVLINQLTTDYNIDPKYGDQKKSFNEERISFWSTWRLRAIKIKREKIEVPSTGSYKKKKQIGISVTWEAIKARLVEPHQQVVTKIIYKEGIRKYSGIAELLVNDGLIAEATKAKKNKDGSKSKTKEKGFKVIGEKKFYKTMKSLLADHPKLADPVRTDIIEGEGYVEDDQE